MSRVCPQCGRESPVESDFCPACGAPMDAHVMAGQQKAAVRALDEPPMKWHHFLIWVSIPVGFVMAVIQLVNGVRDLTGFDPSLYKPEYLSLVRITLYLTLGMNAVMIPLMAGAEYGLLKRKWLGVRLVIALYALQLACTLAMLAMLWQVSPSIMGNPALPEAVSNAVGGAVILTLTVIYYRKRRKLFSPMP